MAALVEPGSPFSQPLMQPLVKGAEAQQGTRAIELCTPAIECAMLCHWCWSIVPCGATGAASGGAGKFANVTLHHQLSAGSSRVKLSQASCTLMMSSRLAVAANHTWKCAG
ncbi:hypothetical protein HaLaN_24589 [Haematococcus lacustris]|uniref:Uncharacterized protein n=1 Tax=Haematococcus lacustris TaxID=44745 RepID=A0A699ZYV8_HAELA|nr:hypothetical protein HaLaN_24589 [Haematococcus lacustris]